jgi:hypothetical protein
MSLFQPRIPVDTPRLHVAQDPQNQSISINGPQGLRTIICIHNRLDKTHPLTRRKSVSRNSTIPLYRRHSSHRAIRTLIVMNSTLSLRTRTTPTPLKSHAVSLLRPPINMEIIPHLRDLRAAIVQRPLARYGLVVPRARAADIRRGAVLGAESFFESGERVRGAV